ncbi:hypothetical protein [Ralstonia pseudosolanacearum]|uniref:hypothetical protein n=1 Tax=Ralstonia pseudosolanacearum TaxID=1310165 RepID=UPI003CF8768D
MTTSNFTTQNFSAKSLVRALCIAGIAAVVVAALMDQYVVVPRDEKIVLLREQLSAVESDLSRYERTDSRAELRAASGAVDFQAWAEQQPEYFERVSGVECLVMRVTQDKWRVRKRRVGGNTMLSLDSSVGGPAACDRVR